MNTRHSIRAGLIAGLILVASLASPYSVYAQPTSDPATPTLSNQTILQILSGVLTTFSQFLAQLPGKEVTYTPQQQVAAGGNTANPYAGVNAINQLSGVTITNANLTSSEIPDLSGTYLPLSGGTITGNLSVTGSFSGGSLSLSAASTSNFLAANATTTNFFATIASSTNLYSTNLNAGTVTLGSATSTNLFATLGHLTTGVVDNLTSTAATITNLIATTITGTNATFTNATSTNATSTNLFAASAVLPTISGSNATITNSTSTNLFATTASSTNLFAQSASLGALSVGTLALTNALPVSSGGTGWSNLASGAILFGNGSGALATSSNLIWDNTHARLGIGTTSPTAILTLDSSSPTGTIMRVSNSSTGGHIYDWLSTGSSNTGGAGRLDLYDFTAGAPRFSIAANGNVGVGTTSPSQTLSVQGNGLFSGTVSVSTGASSTPSLIVGDAGGLFRAAANTLGVSNALHVDSFLTVGPTPFTPVVDAEIRDVNGDGYTELRLADNPVVPNNFFAMYWHNQAAFIENWRSAGTAQLDISPKPQDGVSNAQISLFGDTITSGVPTLYVNDGSGLSGAAHQNQALAGKGNSYLNAQAGMLGVGTASPLATLHVQLARGATSNEIARFTDTAGSTALGLSLGYNSGGSTNAYAYNRYSSGSASAINFGFGTDFSTGRVLTLTADNKATFAGGASFANGVGIGTTSPAALLELKSVTDEKERITSTDSTLGLSLGYNEGGSTASYIYNRYSGGSASAINFGFGSSYASGRVLTLTQDKNAAFSGGASFANSVGIGTTSPSALLHLQSTTDEKERITGNDGTIGLSFGYNDGGSTSAYLYNRYSGNSASAITFGFGTTFGSLSALKLTKDLNATFGGGASFANGVGIGATSPSALLELKSVTDEKERITSTDSTLGLSLGYNEGGSTASYIYNRYSGGSASAINFGFGSSYASGRVMTLLASGNVGIGTTSPSTALQVNGVVTPNADNTSSLGNATYRWSAVYSANGTIQTSDQRLKSNIVDLNYGLSDLLKLRPVSFTWTAQPQQGTQLGFIAQEVQPIFPETVNVGDDPNHTLGLTYTEFIPVVVKSMQQIASISGAFEANLISWFGNASNGIGDLFAKNLYAQNQLCIDKSDGTPVCITGDQLAAVLASANQSASGGSPASSNASAASTPPVITINGDNPSIVQVGDTYSDLGATITGPQTDLNLGITTFLNGRLTSNIDVDTSQIATDTIDYVATDQNGLTSTSTRTVIVEAATSSSLVQ